MEDIHSLEKSVLNMIDIMREQLSPELFERAMYDLDSCIESMSVEYAKLSGHEFSSDMEKAKNGVAYWTFNSESSPDELRIELPRIRAQARASPELILDLITDSSQIINDSGLEKFVKKRLLDLNDYYKEEYGSAGIIRAELPNATNRDAYEQVRLLCGAISYTTEDGFQEGKNPITFWQWDDIFIRDGRTFERLT